MEGLKMFLKLIHILSLRSPHSTWSPNWSEFYLLTSKISLRPIHFQNSVWTIFTRCFPPHLSKLAPADINRRTLFSFTEKTLFQNWMYFNAIIYFQNIFSSNTWFSANEKCPKNHWTTFPSLLSETFLIFWTLE